MNFKLTTSLLKEPRMHHSATTLPNGQIGIIGGECDLDLENNRLDRITNNLELWDPQTHQWVQARPMRTKRRNHTATLLPDGRILIVGGRSLASITESTEIYDFTKDQWKGTGKTENKHDDHIALLLPDNKVLLVMNPGQFRNTHTEVWDIKTKKWSNAGALHIDRRYFTATLLKNGQVLVAGGNSYSGDEHDPKFCEIWYPETNEWEKTFELKQPRNGHTATLLADGRILIVGGYYNEEYIDAVEILDPEQKTSKIVAPLKQRRGMHSATLLSNGNVVIAGGLYNTDEAGYRDFRLPTAIELWDAKTENWEPAGNLQTGRRYHTASLLAEDKVLFVGGEDSNLNPLASAECWSMEI